MKVKFAFLLAMILMVMCSLGMVAANENITHVNDDAGLGDALSAPEENADGGDDSLSLADLSVSVESDSQYSLVGDEVEWAVAVKNAGATAVNTRVYLYFDDGLKYISHECDAGSYNPDTKIWDVGNLTDGSIGHLYIKTWTLKPGDLRCSARGYTDTPEENFWENGASANVQCSKLQNFTSKSDDGRNHQPHQLSSHESGYRALTKSVEGNVAEAKMEMKPVAGNPIFVMLLSLFVIGCARLKR